VTRDRIIVFGILAVVIGAALSRHVVTSTTFLLLAVVIPSIILHEVSHGVAALAFGDDTAKKAGRLTLNPVPHIDILGTIILPAVLALSGFNVFGYAKPVPINPSRMRHPRNDAVFVSLAGPATNVVLAVIAGLWLRFLHPVYIDYGSGPWLPRILFAFGNINVVLAVFNLVPIPPLDGSAVVTRFLPKAWEGWWGTLRKYGMFILIAVVLVRPSLFTSVLAPVERLWQRLI
jgi:Zn-dependent protease